jgi:hypothetical protein
MLTSMQFHTGMRDIMTTSVVDGKNFPNAKKTVASRNPVSEF